MPRTFQVVIDCENPDRMATFWAAALDYQIDTAPEGYPTWMDYQIGKGFPEPDRVRFAAVSDPEGGGRICFLAVPEKKHGKNRLHLDIQATDREDSLERKAERVDALVARLCELGASARRTGRERGQYFVTMVDVEGNEFCVH
ncbi:VOC family protein [Amycolatopsis anabasis]|uniref:VOC family protein n=1 Tax=Amycolatopsis anabasis TaxID=1840409 RepID=UPI00131C277F|nr:VOC family protein [Amycolatopsis anabasis]